MDAVMVTFIAGMMFAGWRSGFVRRALGIVFIVVSILLGAYLRYPVGAIAQSLFPSIPGDYANLVGYAIAFPLILGGLHVVSSALVRHTAVEGLEREVDGALGAALGAIEAILIISAVVVIVDTYFGTSSNLRHTVGAESITSLASAFNASTTVHLLRDTTVPVVQGVLGPFLPTNLRSILPNGLPGVPLPLGPNGLPLPFGTPRAN
jgi:uncharacterized membrane protein required for colicin V production